MRHEIARREIRGPKPEEPARQLEPKNERERLALKQLIEAYQAITERGKVKEVPDRIEAALEALHVAFADKPRMRRLLASHLGRVGNRAMREVRARDKEIDAALAESRSEDSAEEMRRHIETYGSPEELGEERP